MDFHRFIKAQGRKLRRKALMSRDFAQELALLAPVTRKYASAEQHTPSRGGGWNDSPITGAL